MESTKQNQSPLEVEGKATSQMNANPIGEMATYPFCPMNDDDMLNIIALFVSQCNWGGFFIVPRTHTNNGFYWNWVGYHCLFDWLHGMESRTD